MNGNGRANSIGRRNGEAAVNAVGVVGLGVVGGTVAEAFRDAGVEARGYDRYLAIGSPQELAGAEVVFLCVSTKGSGDGSLDSDEVWAALETIEPHLDERTIVAVKSTVPPGTCDLLSRAFPRLEIASIPEFLVAARPEETFRRPDRVVIGTRSARAASMLTDLMARVAPGAPIVVVAPTEAELIKICSNAMLAAKVAMSNELAGICRRFGVTWPRVQSAIGLDRRIGPDHLAVTPEGGFGGACLPKDLDGLIAAATSAGYDPEVLQAIAGFNRRIRGEEEPAGDAFGVGSVSKVTS